MDTQIRFASGYVWTSIFLYPERKSRGFKNIRIRMGRALNCYTFNPTIEEHFLKGVRVIERVEPARVRGFEGKKKKITAIQSKSKRNRSQ